MLALNDVLTLTTPFSDVLDHYEKEYLEFEGRELSVNRNRLDRIRREMGKHEVITPTEVDRFIHTFTHHKPSTRNRFRSRLGHILSWAVERGYAEGPIPRRVLKLEREDNERTRRLQPDEESELVKHMDLDLRDLFTAALDTGLRRGALLKLRFADLKQGTIVVPAAIQKHRKSQIIPLTKRLAEILNRRGEFFPPNHLMFNGKGFREKWDRARRLAKVQDLHWHDLRGEFASRLDENGVEVSVTSRLLGHANLNTTQRYLRPRVERFRDAIDRLGV